MVYPLNPVPYIIEVEVTNFCNSNCIMCNNSNSQRKRGFMDISKYCGFLDVLEKEMDENWFRIKTGYYPKIVLAGQGEPTLHPELTSIIKESKNHGFPVQLVTNGYGLQNITALVEAGLSELAISLHSLIPEVYKKITGISLQNVLPRINYALDYLDDVDIKQEIWRISAPDITDSDVVIDNELFNELKRKHPRIQILGPSEPWDRDGKIISSCPKVNDDPNGIIWCYKLFFTYNIAWNGDVTMCCVDYNRHIVDFGNVFNGTTYFDTVSLRNNILKADFNDRPSLCQTCRRWKDNEYESIIKDYHISSV